MERFNYWMPTKIHFGSDVLDLLPQYVGTEDVLIITGRVLSKSETMKNIIKMLPNKITVFDHVDPNPTFDNIKEAIMMARNQNTKTVIGFGGGSNMDAAKIVACFANNNLNFESVLEQGSFNREGVNLILIPTTSGTGSEVTNVGVYTDTKTNDKRPIRVDAFWADEAFIDPKLTFTMPKNVTANTGMDAFCHAIESYWNKNSNPVSDELAKQSLKLIFENLENAYNHPLDEKARTKMALASLLAGLAFSQTRTTAAHVFSYPITAKYHVPHGQGCAVSIAALIRHSIEKENAKMLGLCEYLGFHSIDDLAAMTEKLMKSVGMTSHLSEIGANEEDIKELTNISLSYREQLELTPMTLNEQAITDLLIEIM